MKRLRWRCWVGSHRVRFLGLPGGSRLVPVCDDCGRVIR